MRKRERAIETHILERAIPGKRERENISNYYSHHHHHHHHPHYPSHPLFLPLSLLGGTHTLDDIIKHKYFYVWINKKDILERLRRIQTEAIEMAMDNRTQRTFHAWKRCVEMLFVCVFVVIVVCLMSVVVCLMLFVDVC